MSAACELQRELYARTQVGRYGGPSSGIYSPEEVNFAANRRSACQNQDQWPAEAQAQHADHAIGKFLLQRANCAHRSREFSDHF